jgi:homoaconitase/3-isopropylmalate dehydratase large subunit
LGQTLAEKIFSAKLNRKVEAGEYVVAPIDCALLHESFALSWLELLKAGVGEIRHPEKVVVVLDHYVPAPSERLAVAQKMIREVVRAQRIEAYFGEGEGICHQVMMEKGRVWPGALIVGADSHTTSYGALAAAGTGIGTTEMAYVLARGELWFMVPPTLRFVLRGELPERVVSKDILLHIAGSFGVEVAQYRSVEFAGEGADALSSRAGWS